MGGGCGELWYYFQIITKLSDGECHTSCDQKRFQFLHKPHCYNKENIAELEVQSNSLRPMNLCQLSLNAKKYVVKSLVSREVDHLLAHLQLLAM